MSYRVIQWATGNLGRLAIEGILAHPDLELSGVWVHSASKDGKEAGEICGIEPTGVRATRDIDSLLALDADCVLYSPLLANPTEVVRILEAGVNVVTPMGWFFPPQSPARRASRKPVAKAASRCTARASIRAASPNAFP